MKAISISLAGTGRNENQDCALWYSGKKHEIWMIADGATNAKQSKAFLLLFCEKVVNSLADFSGQITCPMIYKLLGRIHQEIHKEYICAKGSLLLYIVSYVTQEQHCFFWGDCRIGTVGQGNITWHMQPHNLIVANGIFDEDNICNHHGRHILFKQLTARRFEPPDYLPLKLDLSTPVVMATDGFWSQPWLALPAELSLSSLVRYLESAAVHPDDLTLLIRA